MNNTTNIAVNLDSHMHSDRPDGGSGLDEVSRLQVAMAARLLRSIVPSDGEIEISLHEIARRLEQIAEAGAQAIGRSPVRM
jgi:hypothetical protein